MIHPIGGNNRSSFRPSNPPPQHSLSSYTQNEILVTNDQQNSSSSLIIKPTNSSGSSSSSSLNSSTASWKPQTEIFKPIMSGSSSSSSANTTVANTSSSSTTTTSSRKHHFIPPLQITGDLPPPSSENLCQNDPEPKTNNGTVLINIATNNNKQFARTISQESDTPVPTPPPPPNSSKLPQLHHYYYPDPDDDPDETLPPPPPPLHHHHHQGCVIHSQQATQSDTVSISSSVSSTSTSSSSAHHHKRKRRHRDSKRSRFRFSFRGSSSSKNTATVTAETALPPVPPPPTLLSLSQQHCSSTVTNNNNNGSGHHILYHHIHHPTLHYDRGYGHHHQCNAEQPPTPSPATRASSITSTTSDTHSSSQTQNSSSFNQKNPMKILQQKDKEKENSSQNNSEFQANPTINGTHRDFHLSMKKPNGGLKSKKLKTLIHPLDRSIVGIFMLTIFFTILALLTGAPTVLFLLILLPIFIFFKKLLQCNFSSIPNHEPVSSVDSYWLHKGHITHCLMYLDKGLSVQQLRDVIATRLLTKPELARFKARLVQKGLCRSPYWKYEPEMNNFDDHVIEDEPIECKRTLRQRLIGFMGQSLPMDKPLWQIRYSTATYCDQVILIIRVHQTLSQSGLVSILTHYLCDSVPVCNAQKARFGSATLSINILRAIIVGPLTFFLWILWAFTRRHHNYLTKAKEIKSIHWSRLDLPKIYRIKQVTRSTLNDVLLASIAGSIRSYLTTKTNIINPPDLTVSIPVDIKPNTPIESSLIGVNYVLTSSPIPTNTEGAIPRLWEVRHLMEELKTSADTAVMYGSHYLLSRFLPSAIYRLLMNLVNRNSSVYMSNMIGPETWLSIGSHRLNKIYYFLSPPSYCSIVYNIFTYDNKLYISIATSSKLVANAKELMRQFRSQIDTLHELLSKRRVPGESKRAKRPMFLGDAASSQLSNDHLYNQPSPLAVETTSANAVAATDLTDKLHDIQDELNQLSGAYEMGDPSVVQRYEELKEEFTTLLYELRRRKSLADCGASNIVINIENQDDDDNDGELRIVPPRRFSVVSIGRRASIVSTLPTSSRVTPPILSRRSMATSPEPPSSPEVAFKVETEC